jgi:molybdopterin molybdotransferase
MPEFLDLHPPQDALDELLRHLPETNVPQEWIDTADALDRVTAVDIRSPHPLPQFSRSSVDGFAVRARDTFGASDSLPAYLAVVGEVPMGGQPDFELLTGQCAVIHTGGMLPAGANAAVMLEHTQALLAESKAATAASEVEVLRAVAPGENVIAIGEDVTEGQLVLERGRRIRPAEIGGLMALGLVRLLVATKPCVAILSSGDEVIPPGETPGPGQVRDVNSYTLSALVDRLGGSPVQYGIVPDRHAALESAARAALADCSILIITAGSSASSRDMTADVINALGEPGVLVHGISTRPGKPTILGVCDGKPVFGLPGNPVSALVNGYLFVAPVVRTLLGAVPQPQPVISACLAVNLPSQAGREDWWPVRLVHKGLGFAGFEYMAEPIFGKSNLIFNLVDADGLLKIPADSTGLEAGATAEVLLLS